MAWLEPTEVCTGHKRIRDLIHALLPVNKCAGQDLQRCGFARTNVECF